MMSRLGNYVRPIAAACCAVLLTLVAAAGCESRTTEPLTTGTMSLPPMPSQTTPPEAVDSTPAADEDANDAEAESRDEVVDSELLSFQPPYSHRTDPFRPPNIEELLKDGRLSPDTGPVELKGFVRNGPPKVLLALNDSLAALSAGQQWGGIEVIEIAPPRVILQRGRVRWTESLYGQQRDRVTPAEQVDSPESLDEPGDEGAAAASSDTAGD